MTAFGPVTRIAWGENLTTEQPSLQQLLSSERIISRRLAGSQRLTYPFSYARTYKTTSKVFFQMD